MSAPGQDVPEFDERSRSAYLSRKDVRVLAVVAIVLVLLMMPVYCVLKDQRDEHVCKQNLGHIFKAMGAYIEANDGRFPPAFVVGEKGEPQLFDGAPYTWMSLAHPGLSARASFLCPAAGESETILNLHPEADKPHFRSAYGFMCRGRRPTLRSSPTPTPPCWSLRHRTTVPKTRSTPFPSRTEWTA
jgi:hypothetical protein